MNDPDGKGTDEEMEALGKEFTKVQEKIAELRSKLPREYESHGWVWLFLRKPGDAMQGGR